MSQGWILLHRQIQDCWIWEDRPYDKARAWIDLLLLANHKDVRISIDGKPVLITRGQLHTSEVKLANRWGWDRRKVSRFLNVLESDRMLTKICTRKGTTLTIVNYGIFQGHSTSDGTTLGTTDGTSDGTPDGTQTNNVKNENNENKKSSAFVPPSLEDVKAYCQERNNRVDPQAFIDFYSSKGWFVGKNKMKDWKAAIRTWESRDKGSKTMGKQNFDTLSDLYAN